MPPLTHSVLEDIASIHLSDERLWVVGDDRASAEDMLRMLESEVHRLRQALEDVRVTAGRGVRPPPRCAAEDICVEIVCFVDGQGLEGGD